MIPPPKSKKPWPTKQAMEQVYELGLWGKNGAKFYSGNGSHDPVLVKPYVEAVTKFFKSFGAALSVVDLGCGDFNIGKQLVPFTAKYVAVDIVPELIEFNRGTFQYPNLEFQCLDIATEKLPDADCVVLRQVLQHLSNAEINKIVDKLYDYKYVMVTEHLPEGEFMPNKDNISGQGTRLKKQSGVDLLAPPFCFKPEKKKQLLSLRDPIHGGTIETTLFTMF